MHRPSVVLHQPPVVFNTPHPVIHTPQVVSHDQYVTHPVPEFHSSHLVHAGGYMAAPITTSHEENVGQSVSFPHESNLNEVPGNGFNGHHRYGEQEFDFPVGSVPFGTGNLPVGLNGAGFNGAVNDLSAQQGFAGGYGGLGGSGAYLGALNNGPGGYIGAGNEGFLGGFNGGVGGFAGLNNGGFVGAADYNNGAEYPNVGHGPEIGIDTNTNEGFAGDATIDGSHDVRDTLPNAGSEEDSDAVEKSDVPVHQKAHKKWLQKKRNKHSKATKKQIVGGGGGHVAIGLGT